MSRNSNEKFVLWIDDDGLLLGHPVENLNDLDIKCVVSEDFDRAVDIIKTKGNQISLILIDVMMAPGKCLEEYDCQNGFQSGLRFIDYMANENIARDVKKIIYTNSNTKGPYIPIIRSNNYNENTNLSAIKVIKKGKYKALEFAKFISKEIDS